MKKSKILIPALSIASVGAIVAPIVTSCQHDTSIVLDSLGGDSYGKENISAKKDSILSFKATLAQDPQEKEGWFGFASTQASNPTWITAIEPIKMVVGGVELTKATTQVPGENEFAMGDSSVVFTLKNKPTKGTVVEIQIKFTADLASGSYAILAFGN